MLVRDSSSFSYQPSFSLSRNRVLFPTYKVGTMSAELATVQCVFCGKPTEELPREAPFEANPCCTVCIEVKLEEAILDRL